VKYATEKLKLPLDKKQLFKNAYSVRFEVSAAVTMKNAVSCDINSNSYLTGNTIHLRYRVQPVNAT
jgi:hypothetical protein